MISNSEVNPFEDEEFSELDSGDDDNDDDEEIEEAFEQDGDRKKRKFNEVDMVVN